MIFCTTAYAPDRAGGAETQARLQAEELTRRGWAVEVVCMRWPGTTSGEVGGVRVHRLPVVNMRRVRMASYCLGLFWFLLRHLHRFTLVHVHQAYFPADVVALAARLRRRPVWVKIAASGPLGEIDRMRWAANLTRYVGLRSAAVVQAISEPIAHEVRAIGVPADRIVRLANGIDTATFSPARPGQRARLRTELGLPGSAVLLLYAGRLARHKGIETLMAALRLLPARAAVVLVGSPDTIDRYRGLQPIDGRLIVHGWTARVVDYYRAADAFVLPSTHSEGMPNAVLEAMSCGLVVAATRIGANAEIISHGVDGLLVEPHDSAELASTLTNVVMDGDLRARLGCAAAATVRARYAIGGIVDELERGYQRIGTGT